MKSVASSAAVFAVLLAVFLVPTVTLGEKTGVRLYRKQHLGPSIHVPERLLGRVLHQKFSFLADNVFVVNDRDRHAVPQSIARRNRIETPMPGEHGMPLSTFHVMEAVARQFHAQQPAIAGMLRHLVKEISIYRTEPRIGHSKTAAHMAEISGMAHIIEANPFEYELTYPATQIALNQLLSSELVSHDKEISRHIKKQSIAHLIGEIQNVIHDPVSWAENIRNDLGNLAYYAPAAADVGYGAFAERQIPMGTTVIYAGRFLDTINGESITPYSQICGIPMRNGEVTLYSMEAERQGNVTRFINHSSTQAQFAVLNVIRKGLPVPVYWATKPIPAGAQLLVPYNTDAVPREMNARDLAPFEHLSQPVPAIEVR